MPPATVGGEEALPTPATDHRMLPVATSRARRRPSPRPVFTKTRPASTAIVGIGNARDQSIVPLATSKARTVPSSETIKRLPDTASDRTLPAPYVLTSAPDIWSTATTPLALRANTRPCATASTCWIPPTLEAQKGASIAGEGPALA